MIYIHLLFIVLLVIFIHELGHYCAARIFNITVTDFSLGFGKPIYVYKTKNTRWKFAPILLGGYVKIKGLESIFQTNNKIVTPNSFQSLNLLKKIIVLLSGCLFNILSVWIIFFFIYFFMGIVSFKPIVDNIIPNSSASINDIRSGDIILKMNNNEINKFRDISKNLKNKFLSIQILRNNEILSKQFTLNKKNDFGVYILGISNNLENPIIEKFNFLNSISQSTSKIILFYDIIFKLLKKSFDNNTLKNDIAGPIGIIKNADKLMLDNFQGILNLFIIFSLGVAIFNLIPIPLLDGGHIVYFILRSFFSESLPHVITKIYLTIGISIISFLIIFVTFNDIFYK